MVKAEKHQLQFWKTEPKYIAFNLILFFPFKLSGLFCKMSWHSYWILMLIVRSTRETCAKSTLGVFTRPSQIKGDICKLTLLF